MRFLLLLLVLLPQRSWSQDFFSFLSPESPSTSIEVEGFYLPNKNLENNADHTQVTSSALGVTQRVYRDEKNQIAVGAKYQKLDLTADSLRDFYNQSATAAYRKQLDNNKFWLGTISYGSASDRPFKSSRDNTLSANYIQKLNEKWYLAANYSNNRPFLNNIPLPGFFYVKELTREKAFVFGFPFIYWMNPVTKNVSFRYFALGPWTHRIKILYTGWGWFNPYFGFDQSQQTFFRNEREDRYDRFFYSERRLAAGAETRAAKNLRIDLSFGLSFDRQFFEARNFSENKEFLIDAEKSWFGALNLKYNL